MDLELRFGMHRDTEVIHDAEDLLDGLVIPAHILAYQTPSTSAFVTSLPGKNYVIDPMTFIFQNPRRHHLSDSNPGQLRLSVSRLCDEYHTNLGSILKGKKQLEPPNLPDMEELCANAADFQLSAVKEGSKRSAASKYLDRYDITRPTQPEFVLTPYFRFDGSDDPWYQLSLRCATETNNLGLETPVAAVICCPVKTLAAEQDRILQDYDDFDHIYLWIDDFHERRASSEEILVARRFIRALGDSCERVATLYGGYLLLMSAREGLDSLSHGILYTQHKSFRLSPGSGGPIERYYIPEFHQFRSLSQTDLIIHKYPELMCSCAVCKQVLAGEPDNIIRYLDEPELLRKHFLTVRRSEADLIGGLSDDELAREFRNTFDRYHASVSQLPNPDSATRAATQRGLAYLQQWAGALE